MPRNLAACAAIVLLLANGCTITTRGGTGPESPGHEHASTHSHRPSKHRPARPTHDKEPEKTRPSKPKPSVPEPERKPEPKPPAVRPQPKPSTTKPEPEPRPPVAKPEPPVAKPEPPVAKPEPPVAKPEPPVAKPEPPVAKPEQGVRGFVFGAPADLRPGLPEAFWIYQDERGWHLRTTTDEKKEFHKFSGRIWLTEGKFTGVAASGIERNQDALKSGDRSITFAFDTLGVMDGLDFNLSGTKCVHFEVLLDGEPRPKLIRLGANKVLPPRHAFILCGR